MFEFAAQQERLVPSSVPSSLVTCSPPTVCLCAWRWLCLPPPTWSALSAACSSLSPGSCRLSCPATPSHGSAVSSAGGQDTHSRTTRTVNSPPSTDDVFLKVWNRTSTDSFSSVSELDMDRLLINVCLTPGVTLEEFLSSKNQSTKL